MKLSPEDKYINHIVLLNNMDDDSKDVFAVTRIFSISIFPRGLASVHRKLSLRKLSCSVLNVMVSAETYGGICCRGLGQEEMRRRKWDLQPPNCEKINFSCLSHPVYGYILFW